MREENADTSRLSNSGSCLGRSQRAQPSFEPIEEPAQCLRPSVFAESDHLAARGQGKPGQPRRCEPILFDPINTGGASDGGCPEAGGSVRWRLEVELPAVSFDEGIFERSVTDGVQRTVGEKLDLGGPQDSPGGRSVGGGRDDGPLARAMVDEVELDLDGLGVGCVQG